jgi:hypothetical protein
LGKVIGIKLWTVTGGTILEEELDNFSLKNY